MSDKNSPDTKSTAAEEMAPAIKVCRDVAGGFEKVQGYLPQHPKEETANYLIRRDRRTFFNAFGRTVEGLTGMIFRRDPKLSDDVPEPIREHWENIDNAGTHGDVFASELTKDAIEAGMSVILVDMPNAEPAANAAQEKALGLRPYWVRYNAEDVSAFSEQVGGRTLLSQIVFHEETVERDGKFGDKKVDRYRVFMRTAAGVEWELWVKRDGDNKDAVLEDSGVLANQTEIPASVCYGKRTGFYTSKPPLKDLADLNLLHYETNSDYHHAAHIANVPVLAVFGMDNEGPVVIGPNSTIKLSDKKDCDAKWLETEGSALGHTRQILQDIEQNMATLGLNFLSRDKRAAETAEAKRIGKSEGDSALAKIARSCEDAIEQALAFHAKYMGLDEGGSVEVNKDYEDLTLTPEEWAALNHSREIGEISRETYWNILLAGERLPPDFDAEEEAARLDAEGLPEPMDLAA
jgi:hypothetical protein